MSSWTIVMLCLLLHWLMQNFSGFEHTLIIIQNPKYFTGSTLTWSVINTRGVRQDFFNFNFDQPIRKDHSTDKFFGFFYCVWNVCCFSQHRRDVDRTMTWRTALTVCVLFVPFCFFWCASVAVISSYLTRPYTIKSLFCFDDKCRAETKITNSYDFVCMPWFYGITVILWHICVCPRSCDGSSAFTK